MAHRKTKPEDSTDIAPELPTELAFATDGEIYVNAEGIPLEKLAGRKVFHGYAMTAEEKAIAIESMHKTAFNVTFEVQQRIKARREAAERRRRRKR